MLNKEDWIDLIIISIVILILGIMMARGASFSGSFYNEQQTINIESTVDKGNACLCVLELPDGMYRGNLNGITMNDCGESIGNASHSMTFTNPFMEVTEQFVSHGRSTTWSDSIANGAQMRTSVSSKAI